MWTRVPSHDHEATARPLGFPQAGSARWCLGREQVDDLVDPLHGGGSGDPEAGNDRFIGVALMQICQGQQRLLTGSMARRRDLMVLRWARMRRAVKRKVRVDSGSAACYNNIEILLEDSVFGDCCCTRSFFVAAQRNSLTMRETHCSAARSGQEATTSVARSPGWSYARSTAAAAL